MRNSRSARIHGSPRAGRSPSARIQPDHSTDKRARIHGCRKPRPAERELHHNRTSDLCIRRRTAESSYWDKNSGVWFEVRHDCRPRLCGGWIFPWKLRELHWSGPRRLRLRDLHFPYLGSGGDSQETRFRVILEPTQAILPRYGCCRHSALRYLPPLWLAGCTVSLARWVPTNPLRDTAAAALGLIHH